jgi:plastocyanin
VLLQHCDGRTACPNSRGTTCRVLYGVKVGVVRAIARGGGDASHMQGVTPAIVVFATLLMAGCATSRQPPPSSSSTPPATTASRASDPTQGRFINATTWSLKVWVDAPPANSASPVTVTLQPGETVSWTLAQGQHRIVAHAYPVTQPTDKAVARFDRTIALDPKRLDGWFLKFREADFR